MTEIMNCLPEGARKHFIDLRLVRLQNVHALDRIPQPPFFFEIQPVTLLVTLNEHAEEAEKKLQVLFRLRQGEWVDSEVSRFLANIEVGAAEDRRKRLKATPDIEDEGQ